MTKDKYLGFKEEEIDSTLKGFSDAGKDSSIINRTSFVPCVPVTEVKKDYVSIVVVKKAIKKIVKEDKQACYFMGEKPDAKQFFKHLMYELGLSEKEMVISDRK